MNNPFSFGTIVRGDNFFNRAAESKYIIDTLVGGNNLILYAPRRFGKTSLIFNVIEKLEKDGYICIYFDFMPVYSPESFVRLYSKTIAGKQSDLQTFLQTFVSVVKRIRPVLGMGDNGSPEFSIDFAGNAVDESIVAQVLDLPDNLAKNNKRVLVFFDEFQEIDKLQNINFEQLLRSRIQQQINVNYLFFGSKTHLLKMMFNDKKRAFYNAALQMSIASLPERETIKFLQSKFSGKNVVLSEELCRYLIKETGNIPHYIQLLAAEIWQSSEQNVVITKEDIDEGLLRLIDYKSDYYLEVYNNQSNSKKQLLTTLCKSGKNIFSESYISGNNLPPVGTLQRAVKGLINDGIIDRLGNKYFISDPLFKTYISRFS